MAPVKPIPDVSPAKPMPAVAPVKPIPDVASVDDTGRLPEPSPGSAFARRDGLIRRIALTAIVAAALYAVAAAWADVRQVRAALQGFPWQWLPAILALTLLNYGLRAARWAWYLDLLGTGVGRGDALRIFVAALPLNLTPGKVGELLKSYMVRNRSGTPMSETMPAVIVERIVDGLAMLVLAGAGILAIEDRALKLSAGLALAGLVALVALVQIRPLAQALLGMAERLPIVSRRAAGLRAFHASSVALMRPFPLAAAVGIGVVAWASEGIAFALIAAGVGAALDAETILFGIFAFSIATVVGAMVATPGGVGGVEGVLIGLAMEGLGLARGPAVGAALLARLATLWFGVGIGLAALARWRWLLEPDARGERAGQVGTGRGT